MSQAILVVPRKNVVKNFDSDFMPSKIMNADDVACFFFIPSQFYFSRKESQIVIIYFFDGIFLSRFLNIYFFFILADALNNGKIPYRNCSHFSLLSKVELPEP